MDNIIVTCNKVHDIPSDQCAFCEIERLRAIIAQFEAVLREIASCTAYSRDDLICLCFKILTTDNSAP